MIGKRYLAQKIKEQSSPRINKVKSLSSLFENTIASSSTQPQTVRREIKATRKKSSEAHSSYDSAKDNGISPEETPPPTHSSREQDLPKNKNQPCEQGPPPEIESLPETPPDLPYKKSPSPPKTRPSHAKKKLLATKNLPVTRYQTLKSPRHLPSNRRKGK